MATLHKPISFGKDHRPVNLYSRFILPKLKIIIFEYIACSVGGFSGCYLLSVCFTGKLGRECNAGGGLTPTGLVNIFLL